MDSKWTGFFIAAITAFTLIGVCSAGSEIPKKFKEALEEKDFDGMTFLVEQSQAKIPSEIKSLLDEAFSPLTNKEERESEFIVAEFMANEYKNLTGNIGLLKGVKKRIFESRLNPPQVSKLDDGVNVVRLSKATNANTLFPNNITIKKGGTVRWVNEDSGSHILASMPVIGARGISSPKLEPGQGWEFKFEEPGVYYYICLTHKQIYGKVTVEDSKTSEKVTVVTSGE